MTDLSAQAEWQATVLDYASAINAYVERGQRTGWKKAGKEPAHGKTTHLLRPWRQALEAINQPGVTPAAREAFREAWPLSHAAVVSLLDENGLQVSSLALLDDGRVVARIGAPYQDGEVVVIEDDRVVPVSGIAHFGRCPLRRHFAVANAEGVAVTDGWNGPVTAHFAWPTGQEDLPDGAQAPVLDAPPVPTQLIPFPGGQRVLLVSSDGIFVLAAGGARRVLPSRESIAGMLADDTLEPDDISWGLAMDHGAVSPDGRWIAVGCQDGRHTVLDAELNPVACIGPVGEYPHFAMFDTSGTQVLFNACHFYNGATLGVAVADLPGLDTDHYSGDPRTPTLQHGARVYAGVHHGDEYIVGDAHGYLRAFSHTGEERWQHFIGSTVGALDISADGRLLVATTCAGFVSFIRLNDERGAAPWQIGTGPHRELRRWLFWKGALRPLLW